MFPAKVISAMIGVLPLAALAYDLLHPVPASELREFSIDRPDTTEGPFTVDAGHFQVEWDVLSVAGGRLNGVDTQIATSSVNLKLGLSENTDLQLVLEPHTYERTRMDGINHSARGLNDTELRLKINLWGNDGGDTAFALLPFLRLPTHSDAFGTHGKTEGGLILPLAFTLPGEWDAGAMLEADAVRDTDNDRYILREVQSVTFGHDIRGGLTGFFEFVHCRRHEDDAGSEVYFDTGLIYDLDADSKVDAGCNVGLNDNAQDWRCFTGFSRRF